jgi:outer membrane protein assembly factor BamB
MYQQKGQLNPRGGGAQSNLQTTTVRQFDGGLNVMDTDLNMSAKYARILDNLERATDGSLALRPGTVLFTTLPDTSPVVNHIYFLAYIIVVQQSGAFTKVDGAGTCTQMWLVGQPSGTKPWTANTTYTSFALFNNDLIACNGKDKPVLVKGNPSDANYMQAQYLIDEASLTNVNTPVGKYCVTHSEYMVIAGVSTDPTKLFISAKDTSGTFFGDPPPNDAIILDLGPRVSLGDATITGIVAYRDKLLVTFERGVLPVNLGVYSGSPAVHTPSDDGFIEEYGCLCHRSLISVGDDTFFADNIGVNSINRINIFYTLRPLRASHLVDPLTTAAIQPLSQNKIQQYMFAVYDLRNFRYMLFVPTFAADGVTVTETVVFSYTNMPTMKIQAWARLRGWIFNSACRTELQNIIFSQGNKLYAYDFDNEKTRCIDYYNDPAVNGGNGVPISYDWEMPWTDLHKRMNLKYMKYIALDTQGTSLFTCRAYVDYIYNYGGQDTPLISMDLVGGDNAVALPPATRNDRPTNDARLYGFPAKFEILKLRFTGTTTAPVRFISISIGYVMGSLRR